MSTATLKQLMQVMSAEAELLQSLDSVLQREHEVLVAQEPDTLAQVVAQKDELLKQLNDSARMRASLTEQAGYSADTSGFRACLQSDTSGRLQEVWLGIEQALEACQRQNQINGKLMEVNRRQVQELLGLLLGRNGETSELYDAKGYTSSNMGGSASIKV